MDFFNKWTTIPPRLAFVLTSVRLSWCLFRIEFFNLNCITCVLLLQLRFLKWRILWNYCVFFKASRLRRMHVFATSCSSLARVVLFRSIGHARFVEQWCFSKVLSCQISGILPAWLVLLLQCWKAWMLLFATLSAEWAQTVTRLVLKVFERLDLHEYQSRRTWTNSGQGIYSSHAS